MKKITTLQKNIDYFWGCYDQKPYITRGFMVDIDDDVTVRFGILDFENINEYYIWCIEVYSETDNNKNDLLKRFESNSIDEFNDGLKKQLEKWYIENDNSFIH